MKYHFKPCAGTYFLVFTQSLIVLTKGENVRTGLQGFRDGQDYLLPIKIPINHVILLSCVR